jgi:hypothetical protein
MQYITLHYVSLANTLVSTSKHTKATLGEWLDCFRWSRTVVLAGVEVKRYSSAHCTDNDDSKGSTNR